MLKKAFTFIELIFVIVIIGILSAVAIPKFRNLTTNSKIAAEKATASSIQTIIEDTHGEWSVNEGHFTWGNSKYNLSEENLTFNGYPKKLGEKCSNTKSLSNLNYILKSPPTDWSCSTTDNITFYFYGPAYGKKDPKHNNKKNNGWEYNSSSGKFQELFN